MKFFIAGEWTEASDRESFSVINPANSQIIDSVPKGTGKDVARAADAAEDVFKKWSALPAVERCRILLRIAELTRLMQEELALSLTTEQGKPLNEAAGEVGAFANTFEYFAALAGRVRGAHQALSNGEGHYIVTKRPIGVVGAILPWNFPVSLMAWKIAPGLAAGNSFVVKPASTTPITVLKIGEILEGAGLPPGTVNIVTGSAAVVGEEILRNHKVRKITFTGETGTGKRIMQGAATDIKRVTLELGGSDPMIVCEDADLKLAVEGAAFGRFRNCGQNCTSVKRLFLQESIAEEFITAFAQKVRSIKVGPGIDPETDMGPIHTSKQREEIESMVEDATARGAKILVGGARPEGPVYSKGFFYEPTVLVDVDRDAIIAKEECFGPALPIFTFRDIDEAIERANDAIYGLGSSVWTRDVDKAYSIAEKLEAGTTWINSPHIARAEVPFGGFKHSGIGRELGVEGLDYYFETKSIQYYDYERGKKWAYPAR